LNGVLGPGETGAPAEHLNGIAQSACGLYPRLQARDADCPLEGKRITAALGCYIYGYSYDYP
jgi:hypothetical protein